MRSVALIACLTAVTITRVAAAAQDDPSLKVAKQHFVAGKQAYEAGDFESAIREFKAARQVKPSPLLEYNIALSYEKLGRLDLAVTHYESYLVQDPAAQNRIDVEAKIKMLQERVAREGAYAAPPGATAPPGTEVPGSGGSPVPQPPPSPTPSPAQPSDRLGPAAAGEPVAPAPREPRFALGLRFGSSSTGGLGNRAFSNQFRVQTLASAFGLLFRFQFPHPNLQGEVFAGVRTLPLTPNSNGSSITISSLGARGTYLVRPFAMPLFGGASVGFDLNFPTANASKGAGPSPSKVQEDIGVDLATVVGLRIELSARYVLRGRHEIILMPLGLHLLPELGSNAVIVDPFDASMPSGTNAARVFDTARRSVLYSFEIGYAFRF